MHLKRFIFNEKLSHETGHSKLDFNTNLILQIKKNKNTNMYQ